MEALAKTFKNIGLDAKVISTLIKSNKVARSFSLSVSLLERVESAIKEAGVESGCDRVIGNLMSLFLHSLDPQIQCSNDSSRIFQRIPSHALTFRCGRQNQVQPSN